MKRLISIDLDTSDIGAVHKPTRADDKDGGGLHRNLFKFRDFK